MNTEAWLTAEEAAAYLKVEPRTLLAWARRGQIKGYVLSGVKRHVWRFRPTDLDTALTTFDVLDSESPSVAVNRPSQNQQE
jgi:excisionase family DNA binding protein